MPGEAEVVAVISHADAPPEIYAASVEPRPGAVPLTDPAGHVQPRAIPPAAQLRPLTAINREWADAVSFSNAEPLRFNSTDEAMIEGWLLRPPGYQEGLRYPLIVRIHGGPVAQFSWGFSFERQWLASQGYAVLYVNPRGSWGYGQEFALALWADWGGPDLDDVLAGVDHLVIRGIADPERLGVGGWSYGGILTNYLITRSDRFQAAIAGASEADYFACYGVDDLQGWWENELGLPYEPEARAVYEALSPIHDIDRVVTPTLFLVGEDDWRVPAVQSEQIYAQLRRRMIDGGPLTGLIVYPGESHGIARPSFVIDRWRRYRAWYDLHLRNDATADPFFGLRAW
jgi:dipeptidyl aminopeptidase/acylaminoacyl peptidase